MLWICQASSPPKQRYSWARVDGRRPLPGIQRLNVPEVQGIYPSFAEGNVNIFVIPRSQVQGGGVQKAGEKHMNIYMCTGTWSTCISGGKFEAVPAYVMSQRWLRTRVFLTMPVRTH